MDAKIVKRHITGKERSFYRLKEVCQFMGYKEVLLVEKVGMDKVDCMSSLVSITQFCSKKLKNSKKLARGIIDPITGDAVCEMAESVIVVLECDQRDQKICQRKKEGCLDLKAIFAVNLDLTHFSLIDGHLNCYYSYNDLDFKNFK